MSADRLQIDGFWQYLERLAGESSLVIDRPKGTPHLRFPELIYPLDYGFLEATAAGDGQGIDVWVGSSGQRSLQGIICSVDLDKRDAELKIVQGCSAQEIQTILAWHNRYMMGAIFVPRPREKP